MVWHAVPQQPGVAHSHPSVSTPVFLLQSEVPALQVYEHFVPLQLADEALVRLHLTPQALQSCVVLSPEHVLSGHVVCVHVQAPFWQVGVGCAQVVTFVHVPVLLHVCVVLPLQFTWPGAHTPEQAPLTHVWFTHADGAPQFPPLHTSMSLGATHWDWPGAHTPVHAPFVQVWFTHAVVDPHVPLAWHVCTPLPEHCVWPGVHEPEHAPDTHAALEHATGEPQLPVASQVWRPVPMH